MTVTLKTAEDIAGMRVAGKLAADVLEMIAEHVKPGVTTDQARRGLVFTRHSLCDRPTHDVQCPLERGADVLHRATLVARFLREREPGQGDPLRFGVANGSVQ